MKTIIVSIGILLPMVSFCMEIDPQKFVHLVNSTGSPVQIHEEFNQIIEHNNQFSSWMENQVTFGNPFTIDAGTLKSLPLARKTFQIRQNEQKLSVLGSKKHIVIKRIDDRLQASQDDHFPSLKKLSLSSLAGSIDLHEIEQANFEPNLERDLKEIALR